MKLRLHHLLLILPSLATLAHCADTSTQSAETKYNMPWPHFAQFKIASTLPAEQLTDALYELFQMHPVLTNELPCHRFGDNNRKFACSKVVREDVFNTGFEEDIQTLTFSIIPRTTDRSYKPDYKHFQELKRVIAEMLTARFGKANVTMN